MTTTDKAQAIAAAKAKALKDKLAAMGKLKPETVEAAPVQVEIEVVSPPEQVEAFVAKAKTAVVEAAPATALTNESFTVEETLKIADLTRTASIATTQADAAKTTGGLAAYHAAQRAAKAQKDATRAGLKALIDAIKALGAKATETDKKNLASYRAELARLNGVLTGKDKALKICEDILDALAALEAEAGKYDLVRLTDGDQPLENDVSHQTGYEIGAVRDRLLDVRGSINASSWTLKRRVSNLPARPAKPQITVGSVVRLTEKGVKANAGIIEEAQLPLTVLKIVGTKAVVLTNDGVKVPVLLSHLVLETN